MVWIIFIKLLNLKCMILYPFHQFEYCILIDIFICCQSKLQYLLIEFCNLPKEFLTWYIHTNFLEKQWKFSSIVFRISNSLSALISERPSFKFSIISRVLLNVFLMILLTVDYVIVRFEYLALDILHNYILLAEIL